MARRRLWWVGPPMFVGLVILISLDSIQWVFLARVQWVAWFALVILPALAHTLGPELLIGAWLLLDFVVSRRIPFLLHEAGTISPVIHACFDWVKSMLSKLAVVLPRWVSSGYFRLDKSIFVIEPGHIRAAVCFLATSLLYFWLRTKRLAPLCYFLLLMTVLVWGLSGLSFFLDAFRVPLFVPILLWLSVVAFHLKADHFYRICQEVSTKSDDYVTPSDPAAILARATQSDDRIILVAAAGGGIQAAAWTARVLTGLEEMCAEKRLGLSPALRMGGLLGNVDFPIDIARADHSQSGKTYRQKMVCAV